MRQDERHRPVNGTAWINVDIAGALAEGETFRLQDDFHAAVNRDWLASAEISPGNSSESSFWEQMRLVEARVRKLLEDAALADESHEAALAQALYCALLDRDARNAFGMAPILPLLERIRSVASLDDLSALLCDDAFTFTSVFCACEVFADKKDSLRNVVYIERASLSLSDADEYRAMTDQGKRMKAANDSYYSWLLRRCGYEPAAADERVARMFALESAIAQPCLGVSDHARDDYEEITYNARDAAALATEAKRYPLTGILAAQGLKASDRFVLGEPAWLATLDDLYTPEHLEDFKAWMEIRTLALFGSFLDDEAYARTEQWNNERIGSVGSTPYERKAYQAVEGLLGMAVGHVYVERYLPPAAKADVEHLIDQVVEVYRQRLSTAPWLSAATRAKAVEKLDALTVRVGYPVSWPDYAKLSFASDADPVQMVLAVAHFENDRERAKVNQPVDREEWLMSPQTVNAYYLPTDNSINILAGILGGVFYDPAAPREQNMGGVGMVIGHEITHAFDKNGSLYDKNGNLGDSWWTPEDRAAFKRRTDAVAAYWNGLEVLPGLNVDGDLCVGEIVADLGGMSSMVQIGQGIEGFDFAAMFKAYARDWRIIESREMAEFLLSNDVHAPAHLRTNGTVQQLDEFHQAFQVQPGDGMYLAPENRLRVW